MGGEQSDRERLSPEAQVIQTLFHIQSKTGESLPFILNGDQSRYDVKKTKRDLIPKARQRGFSSLGIAYQTVDCLGRQGTRAVLISHEAKATQRLLDKAAYYIKHLRGVQPELGRHSRNEFYFPQTESTFYIGTAGAKAFGRGDTITHLHISEYAWWESDALKQVAGLFQAVPLTGTVRIESTGNGRVNDFYYMVENAQKLGYTVHFAPWWDNTEYRLKPPKEWYPEGFENYFQDMKTEYKLDEWQLYWYYIKLLEFRQDLKYMQQEYPSCLIECFQATGGAVFPDVSKAKCKYWTERYDRFEYIKTPLRVEYHKQHPRSRRTYCIGGDPSGGTGNDETAMQIYCLETLEQVLELGSNIIDPVMFAHLLIHYANIYNEAYIIGESNNHGIATHSLLVKNYNRLKIYKRVLPSKSGKVKYGFQTTESQKQELVGAIKECLEMGMAIYGDKTIKQMLMFEEDPDSGRMGGREDGLVIAQGLASVGILKYRRFAHKILEEPVLKKEIETHEGKNYMFFTFEEIFDSINNKKNQSKTLLGSQLIH